MERFSEWNPTPYDTPRTRVQDGSGDWIDVGDWLVCPVIQTRDSADLETSNFEQFTDALRETGPEDGDDPDVAGDWRLLSFGHWGPGWFEILIVRPGSTAAETAEQLASRLEDYPVLDEEDLSRREWEAASEAWDGLSLRERVCLCRRHRVSMFAARRDEIPQGFPYLDDLLGC